MQRQVQQKIATECFFSNQAIERGASLVITDPEGFKFALDKDLKPTIPFLLVRNLESTFDYLCQIFYPDKPKFVMGVTGTNGKTSVVNFSQQLIEKKNNSCVTIGTLGVGGVLSLRTDNTTPDQSFIARILQMAKLKGADYALLEVSSHSIVQKRIKNLDLMFSALLIYLKITWIIIKIWKHIFMQS